MGSNYKINYNVDMVFCIDATGSMGGVIDMVKKHATNFYSDVTTAMARKNKSISRLRIRIIAFRDYVADGEEAMMVTDFFTFPEDAPPFADCVNSIVADGGGDEPEDGLEALGYAINSKWTQEGNKRRQVIVVWTDASTHELGHGKSIENYPSGMAKDFSELTAWWGDGQSPGHMDEHAKRLLMFAPNSKHWSTISDTWNNVIHFPSEAGGGLSEFTYAEILDSIANSI